MFEEYKHLLPENFRKRAAHYFGEIRRAEQGAEAWKNGDLDTYGKLIFESGKSSIENYECGCPELITLYNIMTETDGIYGGRFSGAGFKGCCMALVDPEKAEGILEQVTEKYLSVYPDLKIYVHNLQYCRRGEVMKCIILAAGYATRLYPLTENFPKPLLKVGEKAILDWLVDDISPMIEEFIDISNHKFADYFRKWAEGKQQKITVLDDGTSSNETRLGAVKDKEFAVETLNITDDCVVMAGDNVLDFSLRHFLSYAQNTGTSCVMCHEEIRLQALQKTAVIEFDENQLITSYQEKPKEPKGNHAVPPFYFYRGQDIRRIPEALSAGCGYDAPGSFAAWLSSKKPVHAYIMPGKRYDIGDINSYNMVQEVIQGFISNEERDQ